MTDTSTIKWTQVHDPEDKTPNPPRIETLLTKEIRAAEKWLNDKTNNRVTQADLGAFLSQDGGREGIVKIVAAKSEKYLGYYFRDDSYTNYYGPYEFPEDAEQARNEFRKAFHLDAPDEMYFFSYDDIELIGRCLQAAKILADNDYQRSVYQKLFDRFQNYGEAVFCRISL